MSAVAVMRVLCVMKHAHCQVIARSNHSLVYIYSPTCEYCRMFTPVFEKFIKVIAWANASVS